MLHSKQSRRVAATLVLGLVFSGMSALVAADKPKPRPVGAWYLALDATPFGFPPELALTLPGMAILNADRTIQVMDGGDFGGQPFLTRDSTQMGTWRRTDDGNILATTHFLRADALTGEVRAWFRVELQLSFRNRNTLSGTVNVYALPCTEPQPLQIFSCPDPVAAVGQFVQDGPPDVKVTLRRFKVPERH